MREQVKWYSNYCHFYLVVLVLEYGEMPMASLEDGYAPMLFVLFVLEDGRLVLQSVDLIPVGAGESNMICTDRAQPEYYEMNMTIVPIAQFSEFHWI